MTKKKDMEKYEFRKQDKNFVLLYRRELTKLRKILPRRASIEHIGSSAVKGLGGKGLIDVVIAVPERGIGSAKNLLVKGGYKFIPDAGDKERLFFFRDYASKRGKRRVHLHLTPHNSKTFIGMVALRDYLIAHKDEARKYEEVKRKAVKIAKGNGKEYRRLKDQYLKRLTEKAVNIYEQSHGRSKFHSRI